MYFLDGAKSVLTGRRHEADVWETLYALSDVHLLSFI